MTKILRPIQKMGLTQQKVLRIIILQMITQSPTHAAEIYRQVSENSRRDPFGPTRSRTYVYEMIEKLEKESLIQYEKEGRKKIYSITKEGKNYLNDYRQHIYPTLQKLLNVINHTRKTVVAKKALEWKASPTEYEKKYLSKIVNVKSVIRWYTLHRLMKADSLHGGYLYNEMNKWFGWMSNQGYFYKVLREMDHEGLLSSYWVDEDTRSQRGYVITEYGKEQYDILTEQLKTHLHEVQQALQFMVDKMENNS